LVFSEKRRVVSSFGSGVKAIAASPGAVAVLHHDESMTSSDE
jgi:hypothetical protein